LCIVPFFSIVLKAHPCPILIPNFKGILGGQWNIVLVGCTGGVLWVQILGVFSGLVEVTMVQRFPPFSTEVFNDLQ
jgi:hypothetical protein